MQKTILITGSTDGIGLATATKLVQQGHTIILHGRDPDKLRSVMQDLSSQTKTKLFGYTADLSNLEEVVTFAKSVKQDHPSLDVLINNAGVFKTNHPITKEGYDSRFVVNTFAPYLLTQHLASNLSQNGRIINLSSAAQHPVNLNALQGKTPLDDDFKAYAESKLALTMWTTEIGQAYQNQPMMVAINPGSLLGTKMVKQGFGMAGKDIHIGADILIDASLGERFQKAGGQYFDNDIEQFSHPHEDALSSEKNQTLISVLETLLKHHLAR